MNRIEYRHFRKIVIVHFLSSDPEIMVFKHFIPRMRFLRTILAVINKPDIQQKLFDLYSEYETLKSQTP